jgi:hypothetical protein
VWDVPPATPPGTYRVRHLGASWSKPLLGKGKEVDYDGASSPFTVTAPPAL